jgi:NTE family protein
LWKPSISNSQPLHKFIRKHLDTDKIRTSGRQLRVGATGLNGGTYTTWTERDEDLVEGVLASSAFPAFMLPVKTRGQWWIDGGVRDVTPLADAIKLGATEIDVIMCDTGNPKPVEGKLTALNIAATAIDTALCEVEVWDLKVAELYNALVAAKVPGYENKRQVTVRVIKPQQPLLKDSLDFDPKKIRQNYMTGVQTAIDILGA